MRVVHEIRQDEQGEPLEDFEFLTHHIETIDGDEEIHHCFFLDHIGNLFTQGHLVIEDGVVTIDGAVVEDGVFHVLTGLEPLEFHLLLDFLHPATKLAFRFRHFISVYHPGAN